MTKQFGNALSVLAAVALATMPASVAAKSENAATVLMLDNFCQFTYQTDDGPISGTGDIHYVDTKQNIQILVCQAEVATGPEITSVLKFSEYTCFTPFGTTTNSRTVITPSGKVTGWCKFDLDQGS